MALTQPNNNPRRRRRGRRGRRTTYNITNNYNTSSATGPGEPGNPVNTETGNPVHQDNQGNIIDSETGEIVSGTGNTGTPSYVAPPNLSEEYPGPSLLDYKRIRAARYRIQDPMSFAARYGQFNRDEMFKNFELAKGMALDQLDQELLGLERYVPAAAALKRQQTSIDNIFNQMERTAQVDTALPGVRDQLSAQGERAETYAQGRLPDAVQDSALSLGTRSRAADQATAGGFGATSSVARKTSDLMSAEQRLQIAGYGEQLLGSNISAKAGLLLAPTEYANVGQEIRVMPEVGAGRLTAQAFGDINAATMLSPATALNALVQQKQFKTTLRQRTREFNKSNRVQIDSLNAQMQNQFKLGKFGYMVSQAGVEAGIANANTNLQLGLAQQAQYADIFSDHMQQAQNAQQVQATTSGITELITAGAGLIDSITGGGGAPSGTPAPAGVGSTSVPDMPAGTGGGGDHGIPGGVSFPDAGSVPDTHVGMQSNPDGTVTAIPRSQASGATTSFSNDTNIPLGQGVSPSTQELVKGSDVVLQNAGISRVPSAGMQSIGYNSSGQPVYGNRAKMKSADASAGSSMVDGLTQILDPTGAFTDADKGLLDQISKVSRDASLISELTAMYERGDKQGFVNTLLGAINQPTIHMLTKDPGNKAGLQAAYNAYQMFQHWDRMSPAQKGLAIASTGMQSIQFADGTNLATKQIIKPTTGANGEVLKPGLNVGEAIGLFQAGYNVYSMINNWDQLNDLQRATVGTGTLAQTAEMARRFGMLGTGTTGAEVAITAAELANAGFTTAPAMGVGAAVGPAGAIVPEGYTVVAELGSEMIIAPAGSAASAEGAVASNAGFTGGTAAGEVSILGRLAQGAAVLSVASGAYQIYEGWGTGGSAGAKNGALGGTAMAAGLYSLGAIGPWGVAAVVAISALSGLIKTGKHKDQIARDGVRTDLQKRGLLNGDYQVTLADGTVADMGADGHSGLHNVTDANRLSADHKENGVGRGDGKLHSYDVDYTNDLDYTANMGTNTLMTLLYGGHGDATDKLGGQLANAAISQVGFNQEMTAENFNSAIENVRSFYVQSGITNKADAYQLANQAFAEGRIDETQLITAHQSLNIVFDEDGYEQAQGLMAGRDRGADVASENVAAAQGEKPDNSNVSGSSKPAKKPVTEQDFPQVAASERIIRPLAAAGGDVPTAAEGLTSLSAAGNGTLPTIGGSTLPSIEEDLRPMQLGKEEVQQLNRQRYAGATV